MNDTKKKSKKDREDDSIPVEPDEIKDVQIEDSNVDSAPPQRFVEPPVKVMPTLPQFFKSLVNIPIDISLENRKPQNIIELLGKALGVEDYKVNVASFWFLDFIALQLLRYESVVDDRGRSIMTSWLAGEMKLIQEKKFTREAFFREMEDIIVDCSEKLVRGHRLLHWDIMIADSIEDFGSILEEEIQPKEKRISHPKITKRRVSSRKDHKRNLSEDRSTLKRRSNEEALNPVDDERESRISKINEYETLDVIIDATYAMYGNRFHYSLIEAAFAKPVQLHEYPIPFVVEDPRPIKISEVEKQDENAEKISDIAAQSKGKEDKKKTKVKKKNKKRS